MWDIFKKIILDSKGVDVLQCTNHFLQLILRQSYIQSGNWNLMPYFVLHALTIPKVSLGEPLVKR